MSDVFISYSHKDTDFVRNLVQPLEAEGFSVWWDHTIPPGQSWDDVIARGVGEAKACIVVWSPHSITSNWVKEEATLAQEAGKYLPIHVGVDQPPMGFRRIQGANLRHWNGNARDPQWRLLVVEISRLVRGKGAEPPPIPGPPAVSEALLQWPRAHRQQTALIGLAAIALIAIMLAVWWHAMANAPRTVPAAAVTNTATAELYPQQGGVDPGMVGKFTLDTVLVDFNTHYVDTIRADGTYEITGEQQEDGTNGGDASGNYQNTGTSGRVHTGTVQIIDATHFKSNTTVYQLVKPVLPPGQPNPTLLGTWMATGNAAGQQWTWTWSSLTPGRYHFEGHWSDHGRSSFRNGLWTATSLVSSQTGGGTYGIVDGDHVLINGVVWNRQ